MKTAFYYNHQPVTAISRNHQPVTAPVTAISLLVTAKVTAISLLVTAKVTAKTAPEQQVTAVTAVTAEK